VNDERSPGNDPDALVTIGRFIDPLAAEVARSRLESAGLSCFVQGGGLGSLLPTATVYPILLQVRAADADAAAGLLDEDPAPGLPFEEPGRDGQQRSGGGTGS
jgi:hypothetical protein